ncbi:hypothetical protein K469DRAFT_577340 [Zopfia rhizophila CBS 207.26]|uniref:Luciferase domain-containing protein n=1 Tax=Zopfia rhizophila CBS 207.26 TaxID=1314779 RepID=A0A6A6E2K9_9PEZI|nr:hypothetical protein K469DRAFT_577340 [Zopfia rhizophila CBS 207.26]
MPRKIFCPSSSCPAVRGSEKIFGNEIGHVHSYDGSLHLNLHPVEIEHVIEKAWGERHPLAREDSL